MRIGLGLDLAKLASGGISSPLSTDAAVVILLGQSLNVSRGTKVLTSSWANAHMFVDAVAVSEFDYFTTNNEFITNWASVASTVQLAEGVGQSPCVGVATMLNTGAFGKAYICSIAVGARTLQVLNQAGCRGNIYAAVHRFCDIARASGFTPRVYFYSAHGEADAAAGTTESDYYTRGLEYYKMAQMAAKQAMGDPSYIAPVYLTYPAQQASVAGNSGENDRGIKEAIRRIAKDLPGGVDAGPVYQWPCNTDRTHPTEASYVLRGEYIGRLIASGNVTDAPYITGVTLSGANFTITYSETVTRDSSLNVGTNLNVANALDGFEWLDNGSFIKINSLSYNGTTITGILNSTPVGTIGQQILRYGEQYTSATLTAGSENLAGGLVRATTAGWASTYNPSYTNYRWAIPQRCVPGNE